MSLHTDIFFVQLSAKMKNCRIRLIGTIFDSEVVSILILIKT